MQGKSKKKGLSLVKVWLGEEDFKAMAQLAEKLGFRKVGLPLKTQKPHGFADEWRANTDGISQTYKALRAYYDKTEAYRLSEAARIAQAKLELEQEAARKGLAELFAPASQTLRAQKKNPAEGGGVG